MKDQRGEIVTGVMVAMMVVMMIVGGMHMMHGEHKSGGDHAQTKHDHGTDKDMHQEPDKNEQAAGPGQVKDR